MGRINDRAARRLMTDSQTRCSTSAGPVWFTRIVILECTSRVNGERKSRGERDPLANRRYRLTSNVIGRPFEDTSGLGYPSPTPPRVAGVEDKR